MTDGRIAHVTKCEASVGNSFAYVADHRNVPSWMWGVTQFDPIGELDQGVGATFDVAVNLGPKTIYLRSLITDWVEDEQISMKSIQGVEGTMTWRFDAIDDETTAISVDVDYVLPPGIAGKMLKAIIDPAVAVAIRHVEKHLVAEITGVEPELVPRSGDGGHKPARSVRHRPRRARSRR
ncbi:SRPBCC family protein [Antrihabitans stalactiti]|uniref:SRPBCC family protein n=1 Tax=Antrihabitans stalactiti TaxID=2584121 RepID=UPI00197EC54F|nr:SRPBCC family protein [Antrihabitans stalactiti]